MACQRDPGVYLLGRHFNPGGQSQDFVQAPAPGGAGLTGQRVQNKCEEVSSGTLSRSPSFRLPVKLQVRQNSVVNPQDENHQKRAGQVRNKAGNVKKTAVCHSGKNSGKFTCSAISSGFHHKPGAVSAKQKPGFLGSKISCATVHKVGTPTGQGIAAVLGGKTLSTKTNKNPALRFKRPGLGGINPVSGEKVQEYWRQKSSLHINYKEMLAAMDTVRSLSKPNDVPELNVNNQVLHFSLTKGGGKKPFQSNLATIFPVAANKQCYPQREVDSINSVFGRPKKSLGAGQGE